MRAELRDSLENLYPDSRVGARPRRRMSLDVARGGTVAIHVLVNGLRRGQTLTFVVRDKGRLVSSARWFRLVDVPVEENSGLCNLTAATPVIDQEPFGRQPNAPNPWVVRKAPFRTYDAMQPVEDAVRADTATVALRLHVPIGRGARPGPREFTVRIGAGSDRCDQVLRVHVHDVCIPPAGSASVPYTNWWHVENIADRHGVRLWSNGHWRLIRRYAELAAGGRQNTFWIPLDLIFDAGGKTPKLNRGRLRRFVRECTAAGLHFIEGGHVGHRTGGQWGATTYDVAFVNRRAVDPEGHRVLAALCRQLLAEIEANGWRDRWIQHVADEPTAGNAADYRTMAGMVHKYMPGVPVMDATCDPGLIGTVDIWCPLAPEYQKHRREFEAQRRLGDKVWVYTCTAPGGRWLNRFLDQELLRPVLIGWAMALYRLDGYLHWGLNQYQAGQDPFQRSVVPLANLEGNLCAGDTHIVYPGPNGPWSSLRLEAHREGLEDLELLRRLDARDPEPCAAVVRKAVQGFDQYVTDPTQFRSIRRQLLKLLTGERSV